VKYTYRTSRSPLRCPWSESR